MLLSSRVTSLESHSLNVTLAHASARGVVRHRTAQCPLRQYITHLQHTTHEFKKYDQN